VSSSVFGVGIPSVSVDAPEQAANFSAFLARLASFFAASLRRLRRRYFCDCLDPVRFLFPESLEVNGLDEDRQRRLPRLLAMIGQLSEFPWIHSELTRHLDVHMRQAKPPACLDPGPQMFRDSLFLYHPDAPLQYRFVEG